MAIETLPSAAQKANQIPVAADERGFKTWLAWAVLFIVGLTTWVVLDHREDARRLSVGKTEVVATRFQSSVLSMNSEAVLAAYGNAGSLDRMTEQRKKLQTDLTLLQRGGYLSANDPVGVLALEGVPGVPLAAVSMQLEIFDRSTQVLLGASEQLRRAADAETQMPSTIQRIVQASNELGQIRSLNEDRWQQALAPLRQDMSRPEMSSMSVVFAPMSGGQNLAKQWADLFAARATTAKSLANLAAQDNKLSSRDKALLQQYANDIELLSNQAMTLIATNSARLSARMALSTIRTSSTALQDSVEGFLSSVRTMGQRDATEQYSIWGAMLATFLGVFGVLRSLWVMGYDRWRMTQDSVRGAVLAHAVDRVMRELRRIINKDTSNTRVNDAANSPVFALTSMINQTLSQKDQAVTLLEESTRAVSSSLFQSDGETSFVVAQQLEQKGTLEAILVESNTHATRLQDVSRAVATVQNAVQDAQETSYKGSALAQESSWKMESLRENAQSTSKRVKRLGETAQSIGASTDVIKDISKKIKVLALNVAVPAANLGEEGRAFTLLARELDRLAQNADLSVKEIDSQVSTIQTDAKETVAAMEESTTDVVEIGKLAVRAGIVFKDLDKSMETAKSRTNEAYAQMTVLLEQIDHMLGSLSSTATSLNRQDEHLGASRLRLDGMRSAVEEIRKWLATQGRDI